MKAIVQSNVIAAAVQSLSSTARKGSKAAAKIDAQVAAACGLGESIGLARLGVDIAKEEGQAIIKQYVDELIALDVKGDDLKKPTSQHTRELHVLVVESIRAVTEVADGTLNQMMSRIRSYVDARGATEFDVWGNKAKAAAKQGAKNNVDVKTSNAGETGEAGETVAVAAHERAASGSTYQGVSAVSFHLQQILKTNPKAGAEGEMLELLAMLQDCADKAADIISAQNKAKGAKK